MNNEDVFRVKSIDKFTKMTIIKDEEGNTLSWHKIRWIRIEKEDHLTMLFKETLNEDIPFRRVNLLKRGTGRPSEVMFSNLYPGGVAIKAAKYKNLQKLKSLIPPVHHIFFDICLINMFQKLDSTKIQDVILAEVSINEDSEMSSDSN
ncbi:hypothetical protein ANN_22442 [Periplaneta americana]|uniref:Uncharacterized protein n=1 Tax=Periplaneta americana TaxID=6978 RepID=A0ABQ8S943_PERAM|nr:hypothetical protein ANN_22442 [Periplaneta americana]